MDMVITDNRYYILFSSWLNNSDESGRAPSGPSLRYI